MRALAALLLALPAVAYAEPPAAPTPPPGAKQIIQHTQRWEAECPTEDGVERCWVYVVRRRQQSACSIADISGNGGVGMDDMALLMKAWGCREPVEDADGE